MDDGVLSESDCLTHLSLASLLWDIGKQYSPRCDAAECGYSVCLEKIYRKSELSFKITPDSPKNESGLIQMITVGKSIRHMSRIVRKRDFCLGENKGADQLRGNREADQRLCFRYTDSTISLLLKSGISSF